MNKLELIEKAVAMSGLPPRKNKHGYGALRWLSLQLDVHPTTILRWIRLNHIPDWAVNRINEMEKEYMEDKRLETVNG